MTTKITTSNIQTASISVLDGPKVANVQAANSSYGVVGGDLSASTGGYVKITGSNFITGCQVLIDSTAATSVTFVSSAVLDVAVAAKSAGSYSVYIINPDGAFCTRVNGITFS